MKFKIVSIMILCGVLLCGCKPEPAAPPAPPPPPPPPALNITASDTTSEQLYAEAEKARQLVFSKDGDAKIHAAVALARALAFEHQGETQQAQAMYAEAEKARSLVWSKDADAQIHAAVMLAQAASSARRGNSVEAKVFYEQAEAARSLVYSKDADALIHAAVCLARAAELDGVSPETAQHLLLQR